MYHPGDKVIRKPPNQDFNWRISCEKRGFEAFSVFTVRFCDNSRDQLYLVENVGQRSGCWDANRFELVVTKEPDEWL